MWTSAAFVIDQHNHVALQQAEGNQALLVVSAAHVFARDREVVPDRLTPDEIETVIFDVLPALRLVLGGYK